MNTVYEVERTQSEKDKSSDKYPLGYSKDSNDFKKHVTVWGTECHILPC